MSKRRLYAVTVVRLVPHIAAFNVEASSRRQAEQIALRESEDREMEPDWDSAHSPYVEIVDCQGGA